MAFSKSERYPKRDQFISGSARAFGHPARLNVVRKLTREGTCNVKKILQGHPITGPSMSAHLEILRGEKLVVVREEFPHTYYDVHEENLDKAIEALISFLEELKNRRSKG